MRPLTNEDIPSAVNDQTRTYGVQPSRAPLPVQIVVLGGSGSVYRLDQGSCVIGAGKGVDLTLVDETVSRRHVELTLVAQGVEVRDLGSRNGTFYRDQRVQQMVVSPGTRIRLGRVELAINTDERSLEDLAPGKADHYGGLSGSSEPMRRIYALLERLEGSLVPVLIGGESGTGKEVVARMLHERSMVSQGPFVAVNCGVLDRTLVRSELFGHARGAFTGASEARGGAFEAAANGTLFLDEIGELPLEVQPVLLRALETGSVQRLGETQERPVKIRLVAATNRKLEELVKEGKFREDLYYRLLVVHLELPPLRARPGDIPRLVHTFAVELGTEEIPEAVMKQFESKRWPGNVRELKNAVRAYLAIGTLPQTVATPDVGLDAALRAGIDLSKPYAELKEDFLERFQRLYLEQLLVTTAGNQSEAARISGLERSHLNKLLKRRLA